MICENGWPSCGPDKLDRSPVPGTDIIIPLQVGQPSTIMKAFAADYHLYVESLYNSAGGTDEGGWTPTNSVATSNHLGGTAMDLNWNDHPFHVRGTFSDAQNQTIDELLSYYNGVIYWGGHWTDPIDEMHWQMDYSSYQNPATQAFIDNNITADGFSKFRKDIDRTDLKPVIPGPGGTTWADVSQYQGKPVDATYPYGVLSFRTNSGDQPDTLAAQNAASAKQALETGGSSFVIPYYFFRPGEENCDLHRKILEQAGLWGHDRVISMVDVESDGGKIRGDQSAEVNDEINRLRGWWGNPRRVIGYWNPNADPGLWLTRPYGLQLIIPQYNNRPGDLAGVRDNLVVRSAFAHQYTDAATDVTPWSGHKVDLNWTPYSLAELYTMFGMAPPAPPPPDAPALPAPIAPVSGELTVERLSAAVDKILGGNTMPAHWPSRSFLATDGHGVDDTVGMLLNTDANAWNLLLALGYLADDPLAVQQIENVAAGHFPPDSYAAANTWLAQFGQQFCRNLMEFKAKINIVFWDAQSRLPEQKGP